MTHPSDAHDPKAPGDTQDESLTEDQDSPADARLRARVKAAVDLTREHLTPEEAEEHEQMLFSLARTDPRFSTWLDDQRPRTAPDSSGLVQKKDEDALAASVARRAAGKGRGT